MLDEVLSLLLRYAIQTLLLFAIGYAINFLRIKVGEENFKKYIELARMFVESIEQELGPGMGPDKKSEVMQLLKNASGGKLSEEMMEKMIESAVFKMNQEYGLKEKNLS